jgi:hypothetical protein
VPTAYLRRPRLADRLVFAFDAFWELNTDRPMGMGIGPIPSRAIREYAKDHALSGEPLDDFLGWVRVLDGEYIKRLTPKDEKPGKR